MAFQSTLPSQGATGNYGTDRDTIVFQSTLPSQGATVLLCWCLCFCFYFNPRSPHRERLRPILRAHQSFPLSIHAPLTGSDFRKDLGGIFTNYFNPRSPHRERRHLVSYHCYTNIISIHAPLTGSDLSSIQKITNVKTFQSTFPSQGAT